MSTAQEIYRHNAEDLEKLRTQAINAETWKQLAEKEKATVSQQNVDLKQLAYHVSLAEKRLKDTEARKLAATKKCKELREELKAKQATAGNSVQSYALFVTKLGELYESVVFRLKAFQQAASYDTKDLRCAELTEIIECTNGWSTFVDEIEKQLEEADAKAMTFAGEGADVATTEHIRKALNEAKALYQKVGAEIIREKLRRESYDSTLADFFRDQAKLLVWCRHQRSMLEQLTEPDQIQEFCTSFQNNVSVMETNFLVLMEMAEPLLPNGKVETAMIEMTEVWLSLEVFAFEKLRATLLELHAKSNLEEEAKSWSKFSIRFKEFLADAEKLLEMPTDEQSANLAKPVMEQCKSLLADHDAHLIIVEHLSDYAFREECIKDHYAAIRRTIFSKLTLLTQSFPGMSSYPRKQEYTDRLAELTDWVECKSQSDAWKQLLARVDRMKQLIEENEASYGTDERY